MPPDPGVSQIYSLEIQSLEHNLLEMASRVEVMIGQAVDSLVQLDAELAHAVLEEDDEIDQLDMDIETRCLRILASRHPEGADLRTLGTAIKMTTDIERIGDLAGDIAKCGLKIEKEMGASTFVDIPKVANLARGMFRAAIEAYVRHDPALLDSIAEQEAQVDALYRDLRGQIHEHMRDYPDEVVAASWMLLAIHHIERIADHALNIAERVSYTITGRLKPL